MSAKNAAVLIWDLATCPSSSINAIASVQDIIGGGFSTIFAYAIQADQIPGIINDLSIAFNTKVMFGEYALYDVIANLLSSMNGKKQFNVVLISTKLSVWLSLFQQKQPTNLTIISTTDIRDDFDFSFLPPSIPTKLYSWPNLELIDGDISGGNLQAEEDIPKETPVKKSHSAKSSKSSQQQTVNEDSFSYNEEIARNSEDFEQQEQQPFSQESEDMESVNTAPSQGSPISQASPVFAQRNLLESNKRLNFNRTEPQEDLDQSPPPMAKSSKARTQKIQAPAPAGNVQQVSVQFKPLIEAMKLVGKSMVSYNDFITSLRGYCKIENIQINDAMELIESAVEGGIVIFDKSINYLRFRNRSLSTSTIQYV